MVSIIIPTYNREKLIIETLDSILKQTSESWEAIVVDDGSTDSTSDVVEKYTQKDNRIRLFKRNREPKGAPVCRNIGIDNAKGEYLIFLDSDDVLAPFCIERRVEYLRQHATLDFAVFQMGVLTSDGVFKNEKLIKNKENYLYAFLSHDLPWTITGPIWKTEFIRKYIKGYDEKYPRLQDPEFNTRVLLVENIMFHVVYNSEPDCYYRSHSDKVFNVSMLLTGFELYITEFYERLKNRFDFESCKSQLKYSFIEAVKGFYAYNCGNFNVSNLNQIRVLIYFCQKNGIITCYTSMLTKALVLLYRIGVYKLQVGKYFLRFVVKLIKKS